jgi:hypothetical protein
MKVTVVLMITLVKLEQLMNAESAMLVTGRPLVVLGMITAPPEPVYPVMVIAPLLVEKVNWACTAAGSINSNNSGSSLLKQISIAHSDSREK